MRSAMGHDDIPWEYVVPLQLRLHQYAEMTYMRHLHANSYSTVHLSMAGGTSLNGCLFRTPFCETS
jgi:hypothetical protein